MSAGIDLSRRELLGASAVAGAGLLLKTADAEAKQRQAIRHGPGRRNAPRRADVIVVGGGPSGLTAARAVAKAGRSVIVLEANHRVGGRVLNHHLGPKYPGKITELGATFIGPTQDHMYALVKEMGFSTFHTYDTGLETAIVAGHKSQIKSSDPTTYVNMGPTVAVDAVKAIVQLDDMASKVPVKAPWTAASADAWDSQTFDTWLQQNLVSDSGRAAVSAVFSLLLGVQPREVSTLFAAYYVACAGNEQNVGTVERLISTTGGAQQDRVVGGTQAVFQAMARQLGSKRIVLGAPATRIVTRGKQVEVITDIGAYTGKRVIVAMSPALCGRIRFEPGLPAQRAQALERFPTGSYSKVELLFDKPFWREDGSNGQAFGDVLVAGTFDQSPPDGSPGIMSAFICGEHGREWLRQDAATRRNMALDCLSQYYGPRMLQPNDYLEWHWDEQPWAHGGPVGVGVPGSLTYFAPSLRPPVGPIHWAGTETSDYWVGYMDGALRSGERAAAEALAEL